MIFNSEQKGIFKDFISKIQVTPLRFEEQEKTGGKKSPRHIWCCDWWTIEMLKCFYWGEPSYRLDPIPNRLKNNSAFGGGAEDAREDIIKAADCKRNMAVNLKKVKDLTDTLLVCEVGRGLDIIIALMIKPWEKIICYDSNFLYEALLNMHFPEQNIEFKMLNSGEIDWVNFISEPVIIIADNTRLGTVNDKIIMEHPNVKAYIHEGVLRKPYGTNTSPT